MLKNELNDKQCFGYLFLSSWKMVLGLQSGDVVKVLNNSVLTVLFRLTRSRDHLYAFVTPNLCS